MPVLYYSIKLMVKLNKNRHQYNVYFSKVIIIKNLHIFMCNFFHSYKAFLNIKQGLQHPK